MRALHQQPYCEKRALTQQSNLKLKENTHRCSWQTQIVQLSWSIGRERVTQSLAAPFGWRLTRIADCQWSLWQGQVSQEGLICRSDQYVSTCKCPIRTFVKFLLLLIYSRWSCPCAHPSLLSVAPCVHWPIIRQCPSECPKLDICQDTPLYLSQWLQASFSWSGSVCLWHLKQKLEKPGPEVPLYLHFKWT